MPANGDGADAEQRCHVLGRQPFELVHHHNGAATRGQDVERAPDRSVRDERTLLIRLSNRGSSDVIVMALADRRLAPLIAADVDEDTDKPRLLVCVPNRDRRRRSGRLEKTRSRASSAVGARRRARR